MTRAEFDRRDFLRRTLVGGAGAVVLAATRSTLLPSVASAQGLSHARSMDRAAGMLPLAGTAVCLLGAHALPRGTEVTQIDSTLALESELGRQLAIVRRYSYWDNPPPDSAQLWAAQGGRIPYISWHAYSAGGHNVIPWASIARGDYDAFILQVGQKLAAFGYPIYFSFHHEPENDPANGTPADFQAAFTRVRSVMDSAGATNLRWVCTLMASTFRGGHGGADAWLPSPSVYTFIGADGYNRFPIVLRPAWKSFSAVLGASQQKAASLGKKLFVGEFGTVEQTAGGYAGDPQAKAVWFQDAASAVTSWGNVEALNYSHALATFFGSQMPYWVDTSPQSLASFKSVAFMPYFNG